MDKEQYPRFKKLKKEQRVFIDEYNKTTSRKTQKKTYKDISRIEQKINELDIYLRSLKKSENTKEA